MSDDRGGGWVVAQFVVLGAILVAVVVPPEWPAGGRVVRWAAAAVLAAAGIVVCVAAGRALGRDLTAYPKPLEGARLAETGPYAIVRHPFYAGALLLLLGWSLVAGPVALALTLALALLWAGKARVEEGHLRRAHPEYAAYAARVRWRLVPGVY